MIDPVPPADYYAIVSRVSRRPACEVWFWGLRDPLPAIRVPLRDPDPDVALDLQRVFSGAYDRAGYAYSLRYDGEVAPALSPADLLWVRERLASRTAGA